MAIPLSSQPQPPPRGSYTIRSLRRYDFADYHSAVLHMTGRGPGAKSLCDDSAISSAHPSDRLLRILAAGQLRAFPMFGINERAACFTENSPAALNWLIQTGKYSP